MGAGKYGEAGVQSIHVMCLKDVSGTWDGVACYFEVRRSCGHSSTSAMEELWSLIILKSREDAAWQTFC
jgi:hypothetical protein